MVEAVGMNRIDAVFGVSRVLLPVVHPVTRADALRSIEVVVGAGCRGIFLIDQGMTEAALLPFIAEVQQRHPKLWVGVNLLNRRPADTLATVLAACGRIDGIWSDNANIDEHSRVQPVAQQFVDGRAAWDGLYFGGVAFKYQREVAASDLGRATAVASGFMDVVCTSGAGTGKAVQVEKVRAMHEGLPANGALALASGVTTENVAAYLPYVHAYLVGTGIEERLGVIDARRVTALRRAIEEAA
jgi:uncharacterized protein